MEHLTEHDRDAYRRRALSPQALLAIDDHLAGCTSCRMTLRGALAVEAILPQLGDAHLQDEQIHALAEGQLSAEARRRAESHLQVCGQCRAEVEDLRVFVQKLDDLPAPRREMAVRRLPWIKFALIAALAVLAAAPALYWWKAAKPQTVVLSLNDGGAAMILNRDGKLVTQAHFSPSELSDMERALTTGEIPVDPSASQLRGKSATVRARDPLETFELQQPIATAVLSERPTFTWKPLARATAYRVGVYAPGFRKVAQSDWIVETSWTPPQPLERGRVYSWQVVARRAREEIRAPGLEAPEARFAVASATDAAAIEAAKRDHPDAHLLLALRYAQAGVIDRAEEEFRGVIAANPQTATPLLQAIGNLKKDLPER